MFRWSIFFSHCLIVSVVGGLLHPDSRLCQVYSGTAVIFVLWADTGHSTSATTRAGCLRLALQKPCTRAIS
jgi:hypothetical protein